MRIAFGGPGAPQLSGGMIMTFMVGNSLLDLGHEVEYLTEEEFDLWSEVRVPHRRGSIGRSEDLEGVDAVITGAWGVEAALEAGAPVVAHLCLGYEPHLWPSRREHYERIYSLPSLKLVIAPHLRETMRRDLGVEATFVGAPVDLEPFTPATGREPGSLAAPAGPPRVLTVGPEPSGPFAPVPFKGIADVLEIVRRARSAGGELELVRLTPREDELTDAPEIDELHVGIEPPGVPEIYRGCDIYLGASTPAEALGMPAVEAACAGLALVLPEIPSFLEIEELRDCALFYPAGDVAAAVEQLGRLLTEPRLRGRLAGAADRRALIDRHHSDAVAARTAKALQTALRAR